MSVDTIRGLSRGLIVLRALNVLGATSAHEVAAYTGIPRTSVYRCLETLRKDGYVARERLGERYALTINVHLLSSGYSERDRLTERAGPIIQRAGEKLIWPVNVATYTEGFMVLRANTHRDSPLSISLGLVGTRYPMIASSIGLVYLAFSDAAARHHILEMIAPQECPNSVSLDDWLLHVRQRLDEVKSKGFAVRHAPDENRTSSIAFPIRQGAAILGAVNIIWMNRVLSVNQALETFLQPLADIVACIETALSEPA